MGTNLKCFTAQVNTPPYIPNGIKLNETIHQGKTPTTAMCSAAALVSIKRAGYLMARAGNCSGDVMQLSIKNEI